MKTGSLWLKRAFDLLVSASLLVLLAPVLLGVAGLVRWKIGSPVLFCQTRTGLGGRTFRMFKFRTMTNATDASGHLLPDAERMTRLGSLLRKTSLDELPELINVLRGEMSLVGPRPLLPQYLERYSQEQFRRHEMKPGITGWAQVNGRNSLSWEERFQLDVWYVDNFSLWLDLKTLALTVYRVVMPEGISHGEHATMPEFQGNPQSSVAVIGASDHARAVIATLKQLGYHKICVYDDRAKTAEVPRSVLGVRVVDSVDQLLEQPGQPAIIATDDTATRQKLARQLPCEWISVIHPSAVIAQNARIAPGCFVAEGAVILPSAKIGQHVIIEVDAQIEYGCTVGDFSHIASGAILAGHVQMGFACRCEAGATVSPGLSVGNFCIIEAGSVVAKSLPEGVTACGVPATIHSVNPPCQNTCQQKAG